ncbi:hypothetical protein JXD38_10415 [candidate division WOR-3 bacterium]|nr:hypothetical protein [candidate division WOR-3 bacterium]
MPTDDATVVIRSVGERTENVCRSLLAAQVEPDCRAHIVKEMPFSKALKTCYEIGIEEKKKWTVCVDADTLVSADAVERIHRLAERARRNVVQVQCRCISKFDLRPTGGGIRIYRTSRLPIALRVLERKSDEVRPETAVLGEMGRMGYRSDYRSTILTLHDFEQYYSDIFRKGFVFAHKWVREIPFFLQLWRTLADKDSDYLVALWGLSAGIKHTGRVDLAKSSLYDELYAEYSDGRIQEKGEYSDVDAARRLVSETIEHLAELRSVLPKTRVQKLWGRLGKKGPIRSGLYYAGTLIAIAGNWLARVAESGDSE